MSQDVTSLREASGNDIEFEKTLLQAYRETCLPHFRRVQVMLAEARDKIRSRLSAYAFLQEEEATGKSARFSLRAIRGSSLQIGALHVAKAATALEEQIPLNGKWTVRAFKVLEAEFARFVEVFDNYIFESASIPRETSVPVAHSGHRKSSSAGAVSSVEAAEHDRNFLSQSM